MIKDERLSLKKMIMTNKNRKYMEIPWPVIIDSGKEIVHEWLLQLLDRQ